MSSAPTAIDQRAILTKLIEPDRDRDDPLYRRRLAYVLGDPTLMRLPADELELLVVEAQMKNIIPAVGLATGLGMGAYQHLDQQQQQQQLPTQPAGITQQAPARATPTPIPYAQPAQPAQPATPSMSFTEEDLGFDEPAPTPKSFDPYSDTEHAGVIPEAPPAEQPGLWQRTKDYAKDLLGFGQDEQPASAPQPDAAPAPAPSWAQPDDWGEVNTDDFYESTHRDYEEARPLLTAAAEAYGIPPNIMAGVAYTESRFNQGAVSKDKNGNPLAYGTMQIIPSTAAGLGIDPADPEENIMGGAKLLKQLIDKADGDWELALRTYNASPSKVRKYWLPATYDAEGNQTSAEREWPRPGAPSVEAWKLPRGREGSMWPDPETGKMIYMDFEQNDGHADKALSVAGLGGIEGFRSYLGGMDKDGDVLRTAAADDPDKTVPPKEPARSKRRTPVTEDGGVDNIIAVAKSAAPEEYAYWTKWYYDAHDTVQAMADQYDLPVQTVAGVVAVLSPGNTWPTNISQAKRLIEWWLDLKQSGPFADKRLMGKGLKPKLGAGKKDWEQPTPAPRPYLPPDVVVPEGKRIAPTPSSRNKGRGPWYDRFRQHDSDPPYEPTDVKVTRYMRDKHPELKEHYKPGDMLEAAPAKKPPKAEGPLGLFGPSMAGMPVNVGKAIEILETNDPSAYIVGPKVSIFFESIVDPEGLEENVVLDGHAINIWRGTKIPLKQVKSTSVERVKMMEDYQKAAGVLGVTPQGLQALTWYIWKTSQPSDRAQHPQEELPLKHGQRAAPPSVSGASPDLISQIQTFADQALIQKRRMIRVDDAWALVAPDGRVLKWYSPHADQIEQLQVKNAPPPLETVMQDYRDLYEVYTQRQDKLPPRANLWSELKNLAVDAHTIGSATTGEGEASPEEPAGTRGDKQDRAYRDWKAGTGPKPPLMTPRDLAKSEWDGLWGVVKDMRGAKRGIMSAEHAYDVIMRHYKPKSWKDMVESGAWADVKLIPGWQNIELPPEVAERHEQHEETEGEMKKVLDELGAHYEEFGAPAEEPDLPELDISEVEYEPDLPDASDAAALLDPRMPPGAEIIDPSEFKRVDEDWAGVPDVETSDEELFGQEPDEDTEFGGTVPSLDPRYGMFSFTAADLDLDIGAAAGLSEGEQFKVGRYGPTWEVVKSQDNGARGFARRLDHVNKWFGFSFNETTGEIVVYPVKQGSGERTGSPVAFGPMERTAQAEPDEAQLRDWASRSKGLPSAFLSQMADDGGVLGPCDREELEEYALGLDAHGLPEAAAYVFDLAQQCDDYDDQLLALASRSAADVAPRRHQEDCGGPEDCGGEFECAACRRPNMGWCMGGDDDPEWGNFALGADLCDDCWIQMQTSMGWKRRMPTATVVRTAPTQSGPQLAVQVIRRAPNAEDEHIYAATVASIEEAALVARKYQATEVDADTSGVVARGPGGLELRVTGVTGPLNRDQAQQVMTAIGSPAQAEFGQYSARLVEHAGSDGAGEVWHGLATPHELQNVAEAQGLDIDRASLADGWLRIPGPTRVAADGTHRQILEVDVGRDGPKVLATWMRA